MTVRRGFRLWRLRIEAFLLPPRVAPRDVVQDREVNSRLLGRLTGYAGLWAIGALALTMVKLVIGFGGNANYLAAVLERVSLSGLASMTLATMTVSVIPVAMV